MPAAGKGGLAAEEKFEKILAKWVKWSY